jgi:hypothetical protein
MGNNKSGLSKNKVNNKEEKQENNAFLKYFNTRNIDSFENIYGKNYIEELILSDKLLFLQAQ